MITFVLFEDHLLYEAKTMRAIHEVMKKQQISYRIQRNVFPYDNFKKIYLIELDRKDSFEVLKKIRLFDLESEIIVFSSSKNKKLLLKQKHLKFSAFLEKEEIYQGYLNDVLEQVLLPKKTSNVFSFMSHNVLFQIPKDEILMITMAESGAILHAMTKENVSYQYFFRGTLHELLSQLGDEFLRVNRYCIVPIDRISQTQTLSLEEPAKKKHYQKPYSKSYRKKLLFEYEKGVSIAKLSRQYGPCEETIRRWLKEEAYEKNLKKALKYDKISKIVKEGD